MLTVMVPTISFILLNSASTTPMPGARIDEAKGVTKVMADTRPTMSHFLALGKLRGMVGSSWPSQPTTPASRSLVGMGAKAMRSRFSFRDSEARRDRPLPRVETTRDTRDLMLMRVSMRCRSAADGCWEKC